MGILAAILSAFLSAIKEIVSKKLSGKVDATVSTFASFAFAVPYYLVVIALCWLSGFENFKFAPGFFYWIIFRSLSDAFAELFRMHAYKYGDLSVVSSLFSLYPIILLITSPLITGDKLTAAGAVSVIVTIVGTIVILYKPRNAKDRIDPKAILFSLAAAICFSLNSCFDRLAVQTGTPLMSGFMMTLLAGVFILPMMLRKSAQLPQLAQYRVPFLQRGFFEITFMVVKLYALTLLQAPYVVGLQRISVLLSVVSGRVFFKEEHFVQRLIGACLVVAGVVSIVFQLL